MKNILLAFSLLFSCCVHAQIITTVAGNGISSHSGDGGPATIATHQNPVYSGAFESYGKYYFAERFAHRFRKISTSGIITTVAGTVIAGYSGDSVSATSAELNYPNGVA